ncbi:hypothetical protein ACH4ND_29790 [Streptomyces sp. NPDC017179]|uniref:hypothetical protein n=1 Tax=Streptomyces sp. NPDC017179 TaxID=3364979 RepID=UPI003795019B
MTSAFTDALRQVRPRGTGHEGVCQSGASSQLTALVKSRLKRMQYRPRLIEGLIAKTGLDFQPL